MQAGNCHRISNVMREANSLRTQWEESRKECGKIRKTYSSNGPAGLDFARSSYIFWNCGVRRERLFEFLALHGLKLYTIIIHGSDNSFSPPIKD